MKIAVIGSGAAGTAAAFKLKSRKHDVVVFQSSSGATGLSSGTLDLLGPKYFSTKTMEQAFIKFRRDFSSSVYAKYDISFEDIHRAVMDWIRWAERGGLQFVVDFDQGLALANVWGFAKWSLVAQKGFSKGDLRQLRGKNIGLGTIDGLPLVDPRNFMSNISKFTGASVTWSPFSIPWVDREMPDQSQHIARRLENQSGLESFVQNVKRNLPRSVNALALPPVLGILQVDRVVAALERDLGIPVFELVAIHESIPGLRLSRALVKALEVSQINCYSSQVMGLEEDTQGVRLVTRAVARTPSGLSETTDEYYFDRVLIAGGRYIGGALTLETQGARSQLAVLDLGLDQHFPHRRQLWAESFFEDQPAMKLGFETRPNYQVSDRVYVAGSALGGCDWTRETSGMVASVVTGSLCGERI